MRDGRRIWPSVPTVENIRQLAWQMSRCAQDYGEQSGATYAEAFKVLHPFCDT